MSIYERIKEMISDQEISALAFEKSIGKSNGWIQNMKKRKSSTTIDVIEDIVKVYSNYSLNWLVLGKGPKYIEDAQDVINEDSEAYMRNVIDADILALNKRMDVIIQQNKIILDKLDRGIAKSIIAEEKERMANEVDHKANSSG